MDPQGRRGVKTTFCKSCSAEILFLRNLVSGRNTPVDVDPHPCGTLVISLEDGQCRQASPSDPITERHTNHLSTCPNAEEWRNGGA